MARKQAVLTYTDGSWTFELEGDTGLPVAVDSKTLKAIRKQHELDPDKDDGATVIIDVQKNVALRRWDVKGLVEVRAAGEGRQEELEAEQARARQREERQRRDHRRQQREKRVLHGGRAMGPAELADLYAAERSRPSTDVNAYTFLPYVDTPPADRWQPARPRTDPGQHSGLLSGTIRLRLDVVTPVAIGGKRCFDRVTHRGLGSQEFRPTDKGPSDGHSTTDLRRDASGRPIVPGATLKGALRTWFEAITSSPRRADPSPVAWRSAAIASRDDAAPRRLGRIEFDDAAGLQVTSEHRKADDPATWEVPKARIHPLRTWEHDLAGLPGGNGRKAVNERVDRIAQRIIEVWKPTRLEDGIEVSADGVSGRLKVGKPAGTEPRVSLQVAIHDDAPAFDVAPDPLRQWVAAHRDAGPPDNAKKTHGLPVVIADPRELQSGDLVWYQLNSDGDVIYLGRIRNGRWAVLSPLENRTPPGHDRPSPKELAPSERMFGTVDDSVEPAALAGRLRVTTARWHPPQEGPTEPKEWEKHYTLVPLSSPKLSAAGFYLDSGGNDGDKVAWTDEAATLAGTKVYWHTVPGPGLPRDARVAVARDRDGAEARTEHNTTVTAVTGGSFACDIHFEDLDERELGALVLACRLDFDGDSAVPRGWKLGIGKPVGLGSVRNVVERVETRSGWATDPTATGYQTLDVDPLVTRALATYLSDAKDQDTFAAIASHDTHRQRMVGYPNMGGKPGGPKTTVGGEYTHQPSADEVIGATTGRPHPMELKGQ